MSDWDDRELDSDVDGYGDPTAMDGQASGESLDWLPWIWAAVALALAVGLGFYWLLSRNTPEVGIETPVAREAPSVSREPPEVEEETPPEPDPVDLPSLAESDDFLRNLLTELSSHPALASLLMSEDLARKLVVAVVNVAEGDNPARHFPQLAPEENFDVVRRSAEVYIDPRSYHRYDTLAEGFVSLDTRGLVETYRVSKPLLEEAYRELGYLDVPFEATLAEALSVLLHTPIEKGRIRLRAVSVNYTYADARLEALDPAQKQLLRMGPDNVEKIQTKLREIAEALGLTLP